MITKDELNRLKQENLSELYKLLNGSQENREVLFVLENLGSLPNGFDGDVFVPFTRHPNDDIRFWAVKNIGKVADEGDLKLLNDAAQHDSDSMVRREAISSIGRMRSPKAKKILSSFLSDADPKVVLQAIRGLLVFKGDAEIQNKLLQLKDHPNETIQSVIRREFSKNEKSSSAEPHPVSPEFLRDVVVQGDVREVLKYVPDESLHLTFTSPPYYNARDYSIYVSYNAYLDFLEEVFNEVHRVTKEGRFLIVNTSPVIVPRVSRAHASKRYPIPFDLHARLVNIGWEFVDDIIWLKPESSVKNRNAGFLQHRKPLAYKPNAVTEYLMVYRKQTDQLLDWNMRQYDWDTVEESKIKGDYETSNVWKIDPTFDRVHSAVFPLELCNRVVKFYSYKGDLIFDPFGGSGTLGKAARNLNRHFFLTEQEPKYVERMKADLGKTNLFQGESARFLTLEEFAVERAKEKP
ncbi:MAG: HEAT repeat domain-containing protein [Anaerolineales bacterium]|nr:HEAT repeat domain-containing protein [Anaerolineales bacterium]